MSPESLIAIFTGDMSAVLADVYVVFAGLISILIILFGGRIIRAALSLGSSGDEVYESSGDKEYDKMVDKEEEKYHQGILRGNAKYEVSERHKYDL